MDAPAYRVRGQHQNMRTTFLVRTLADAFEEVAYLRQCGYVGLTATGPDDEPIDLGEAPAPAWRSLSATALTWP